MHLPRLLPLPPETDRTLKQAGRAYWFPLHRSADAIAEHAAINMCADLVTYSNALASMARTARSDLKIFNHPLVVQRCRPDIIGRVLMDVPGREAPRTLALSITRPEELRQAVDESGLSYPFILRNGASASEADAVVIGSDNDWKRADDLAWWRDGRVTISQLDRSDLQQHIRLRVCVAGRQVQTQAFPFRHGGHALVQGVPMPRGPGKEALGQIIKAIVTRVPLDFWSFDLVLKDGGVARFDQFWVGLPGLSSETGSPSNPVSRALWNRVGPKMDALLRDPESWRSFERPPPATTH